MHAELAVPLGGGLGMVVAFLLTPVAIRVAGRLEFYDQPRGYKGHARPTPYLGGSAVMLGFLVAVGAATLTVDAQRTAALAAGAVLLWGLGTTDDRVTVSPVLRLGAEAGLATGLWALGLGWDLGLGALVDLAATVVWICAVVNAFNLFDNMDGAAGTMGCVASAGIAVLGLVAGDIWVAAAGAALCGACLGFLPFNLSSPARIFLGDGGSMPIGYCVAALTMVGASTAAAEWQALAMGVLLVGIPALDTLLVVVSRARRGIPLLTGGRDHLTHRTRRRLRTARAVATSLGAAQVVLAGLAIFAINQGSAWLVVALLGYVAVVGSAIALLDGPPGAATVGIEHGLPPVRSGFGYGRLPAAAARLSGMQTGPATSTVTGLTVLLGLASGLSPFLSGFYEASTWLPFGMLTLIVAVTVVLARPAPLRPAAWVTLLGTAALAVWALLSASWAESAASATRSANLLVVYAGLVALLLLLVRTRRLAVIALGAVVAGGGVVALWIVGRLLLGDADALLIAGRLDAPLGYINAQASALLLCALPVLALAERPGRPAVRAGAAAAGALLCGLAFLSQSRGVALAALAGFAVMVAVAPGRLGRTGLLACVVAGVAAVSPVLLRFYEAGRDGGVPAGESRTCALALLGGATLAALLWTAGGAAAARVPADRARRLAVPAAAVVALAVLGAGIVSAGRIAGRVEQQVDAFVDLDTAGTMSSSARLTSGGGYRYDYWRVAARSFAAAPVRGVGAGNYPRRYYAERRSAEDVRQPHSLPLQVLAELGLVGGLLLLAALAPVAVATVRRVRMTPRGDDAILLAATAGMVAIWLVETSVDWIHLLPGVTGAALVAAAALLRPAPAGAARVPAPALRGIRGSTGWRLAGATAVAAAVAIGGLSLSRQYLADRYHDDARAALRENRPADALREANRSLRLDRELVPTYYLKAAALARFDQAGAAERVLLDGARLEPHSYLTYLLLGDLKMRLGEQSLAAAYYDRALRLNPLDPVVANARAQVPPEAGVAKLPPLPR